MGGRRGLFVGVAAARAQVPKDAEPSPEHAIFGNPVAGGRLREIRAREFSGRLFLFMDVF
jgi:hypothetical protein